MRRLFLFLLCCVLLIGPVFAENSISQVQTSVTVTAEGDCLITSSAALQLDGSASGLTLLLPDGVKEANVNGVSVKSKQNELNLDNVYGGQSGAFALNLGYTVSNSVRTQEEGLLLQVPLLPGYPYPVESMSFTITLPGEAPAEPVFTSGYHPDGMDSELSYTTNGATISGYISAPLRDHETLSMVMDVTEELFPQKYQIPSTLTLDWIGLGVCTALALLYWLLTMAAAPIHRIRQTVSPAGFSAGEVGSRLTRTPADLTLMVLTWAQLGYLIIQQTSAGQVVLHKKLDMGNERSAFETYWYRALFRRRNREATGGMRYAQLCKRVAAASPALRELYQRTTGNPGLLRVLAVLETVFCGLGIGDKLTAHPIWRLVWMVVLAIGAGIAAWHIQIGAHYLHLRKHGKLWTALLCTVAYLVFGFLSGQASLAVAAVALSWLSGLASAYTGHRTELGRQTVGEILGLRYHLQHCNPRELNRILRWNPNYFYDLAPYALALGVDKAFARNMGNGHLPPCGWFVTKLDTPRSAEEWSALLRQSVDAMDRGYRRILRERIPPKRYDSNVSTHKNRRFR